MVGVGVNHDELVKHAEVSFSRVPEGMSTTEEKCEYVGGKDYCFSGKCVFCYPAWSSDG